MRAERTVQCSQPPRAPNSDGTAGTSLVSDSQISAPQLALVPGDCHALRGAPCAAVRRRALKRAPQLHRGRAPTREKARPPLPRAITPDSRTAQGALDMTSVVCEWHARWHDALIAKRRIRGAPSTGLLLSWPTTWQPLAHFRFQGLDFAFCAGEVVGWLRSYPLSHQSGVTALYSLRGPCKATRPFGRQAKQLGRQGGARTHSRGSCTTAGRRMRGVEPPGQQDALARSSGTRGARSWGSGTRRALSLRRSLRLRAPAGAPGAPCAFSAPKRHASGPR